VKQVMRTFTEDGQSCQEEYAMKMMHKPTLKHERAVRYDKNGEIQMINNLEKVYNEIDVWSSLHHQNVVKIYELIDSDNHDYMYMILELGDLGQLSNWDYTIEKYV
jgi:serine/threonine protein kinase